MEAPIPDEEMWGKRAPRKGYPLLWHPLADHCADVAACVAALLANELTRSRLAALAGVEAWPKVWTQRLAVLAFLHDFGKINRDFQAGKGGHIGKAVFVAGHEERRQQTGLDALGSFGVPVDFLLAVALAHHGEPPDIRQPDSRHHTLWAPSSDRDPIADVAALVAQAKAMWPSAFTAGDPLPDACSPFWHAYLGLLQLADWLGSDDAEDAFPYSLSSDAPRWSFAARRAHDMLQRVGFDAALLRQSRTQSLDFSAVSAHPPTPIQLAAALAPGPIVGLEAETGSGKTEAALWRFAKLFFAGKVDALYFALPTRVAATQMHARVQAALDRLFPGSARIEAVRALPGDVVSGAATVRRLPDYTVQWSDEPDEDRRRARWAAEQPKRFLAASVAVGTIDQALLGAVAVKHAHMRCFCLSRALLVVDEVHASDTYMEELLRTLLTQHRAAGGEALLLSATLGAAARTRLLLAGRRRQAKKAALGFGEAADVPYPALSWVEADRIVVVAKESSGRSKSVTIEPSPLISNPRAIAQMAQDAAEQGAKVIVIRNLVRDAVATAHALHALAPCHPAHFRLDGVPTLHHGRFVRTDRRRLDEAVEQAIGRERPGGPLILVGTQTLEQSLDIDADLLITDLAPMDVLLQRIGRLHRHDRADTQRPAAFRRPRAIVLMTPDFEASLVTIGSNRNGPHGLGGFVYGDLVSLAATREQIGSGATWEIPAMNRRLVERVTHPEALEALAHRLGARDERWTRAETRNLGVNLAQGQAAKDVAIDWNEPVADFRAKEDRVGTRLGLRDIEIELRQPARSPFSGSEAITRIVIPAHMLGGVVPPDEPVDIVEEGGKFTFWLKECMFIYDRYGLQ